MATLDEKKKNLILKTGKKEFKKKKNEPRFGNLGTHKSSPNDFSKASPTQAQINLHKSKSKFNRFFNLSPLRTIVAH